MEAEEHCGQLQELVLTASGQNRGQIADSDARIAFFQPHQCALGHISTGCEFGNRKPARETRLTQVLAEIGEGAGGSQI